MLNGRGMGNERLLWVVGLNRYRGKGSHQLDYQYPACFL